MSQLKNEIAHQLELERKEWKSLVYGHDMNLPYQGYERIGLKGCRSTEKRFEEYNISKYLDNTKTVLDIGSNMGLVSIYLTDYVKKVIGIEINPYLVNIGNAVKNELQLSNVEFTKTRFEDYNTDERFDIILSLANDHTIDKNTQFTLFEYLKKIISLLKKDGLLFFESQATDVQNKFIKAVKFGPKVKVIEDRFIILERKKVKSDYPTNIPHREFLVCKKK